VIYWFYQRWNCIPANAPGFFISKIITKGKNMSELQPRDSVAPIRERPELRLFVNEDDDSISEHRLARCVYAETLASSLPAVEALCAMIKNTGRPIAEICGDAGVFESLDKNSPRHESLLVGHGDPGFQLCLRMVRKIGRAPIPDKTFGAKRFHRADAQPEWANSLGSVYEIDDLLFYL
jgi:hypothetical protein